MHCHVLDHVHGCVLHKMALQFKILAECSISKARVAQMVLPHYTVDTPVFMPVGTQGTLKGMTPDQLKALDCHILLGNTYHLGNRPVYRARTYVHTVRCCGGIYRNREVATCFSSTRSVQLHFNMYGNVAIYLYIAYVGI